MKNLSLINNIMIISIKPKFAVPFVKQSSQVVAQHHNGGNKSGVAMVRWNFYYKSLTVLFPVVVPLGPSTHLNKPTSNNLV